MTPTRCGSDKLPPTNYPTAPQQRSRLPNHTVVVVQLERRLDVILQRQELLVPEEVLDERKSRALDFLQCSGGEIGDLRS